MSEDVFDVACSGEMPGHAVQPRYHSLGGIAMRYRIAVLMPLMLFLMLPLMKALSAPVPDPSALLDIGPPPNGWNMEKHLESEIGNHLTSPYGRLFDVWLDPEIRRLSSVAALKDSRAWLTRNLRVTKEGGSRLRLIFRAGNRREQVAILNTLLRAYIQEAKKKQKTLEGWLRREEDGIPELERRIASGKHNESIARYRKAIDDLRSIQIPARRAEIDRYKKIAVIRWAK
jgi:hypothetical protein